MAPKDPLTYVLVAPCIPLPKGGHEAYTYHLEGKHHVEEGSVVRISFGKRKITGVVLQASVRRPRYPTKPIDSVLETVLTSSQMKYAKWISGIAHGGLGFTLRLFFPYSL